MGRTAADEWFGGSVGEEIVANYRLRLPFGPGGARLYVLEPTATDLIAFLPDATLLHTGGPIYVVVNDGAETLSVQDPGFTEIALLSPGEAVRLYLLDNSEAQGVWLARTTTAEIGAELALDRIPVDVRITAHTPQRFNLLARVRAMGFQIGSSPFAIRCTVAAGIAVGNNVSTGTTDASFATGEWPAGTTLVLTLEEGARIAGRGGRGGNGAAVGVGLLATAGQPGRPALELSIDTAIVNYGFISGGGGGGGGGIVLTSIPGAPGGGGGGGAGFYSGPGGLGGTLNGVNIGGGGTDGSFQIPGASGNLGGMSGGSGGYPGEAGAAATYLPPLGVTITGAAGGAAGAAIRSATGVTVTKLVAGTIQGDEVTF